MFRIARTLLLLVLATLAPLAAGWAAGSEPQSSATTSSKYRVVFHVTEDDPKKWAQVLNNARYSQEQFGAKNIDIIVVTNGGGIGMLKLESPIAQKVDEAKKAGVKFHVCENTMATQHVTKDDMLPQADFVRSGIGDAILLQSQGWSYIKN